MVPHRPPIGSRIAAVCAAGFVGALIGAACGAVVDEARRWDSGPAARTEPVAVPPACQATEVAMHLGQGSADRFQPGRIGDLVVLHHGEAGWTIDPAVRLEGLAPGQDVRVDWRVTVASAPDADPALVIARSGQAGRLELLDAEQCATHIGGVVAPLERLEPGVAAGCSLDGRPLRLEVAVTLTDGRRLIERFDGVAAVDLSALAACD